tara:strand:+ start:114 stop:269 length:156 start_codon:yes stop_codon:yes gene_type:complete
MDLVSLLILLFLGLLAVVVIGKIIVWAMHNNTPGVLLLLVVPLLAYIAYKL